MHEHLRASNHDHLLRRQSWLTTVYPTALHALHDIRNIPKTDSAVRAAIGMQQVCEDDYTGRDPSERIRIAVGIGWGYMLDLDGTDIYGDEVNRASKLGEDLANPGEILVTHAARQCLTEVEWSLEKRTAELSGMLFEHFRVHPR